MACYKQIEPSLFHSDQFALSSKYNHHPQKKETKKKKKQLHKHTLDKINLSLAGSRGSATVKKD